MDRHRSNPSLKEKPSAVVYGYDTHTRSDTNPKAGRVIRTSRSHGSFKSNDYRSRVRKPHLEKSRNTTREYGYSRHTARGVESEPEPEDQEMESEVGGSQQQRRVGEEEDHWMNTAPNASTDGRRSDDVHMTSPQLSTSSRFGSRGSFSHREEEPGWTTVTSRRPELRIPSGEIVRPSFNGTRDNEVRRASGLRYSREEVEAMSRPTQSRESSRSYSIDGGVDDGGSTSSSEPDEGGKPTSRPKAHGGGASSSRSGPNGGGGSVSGLGTIDGGESISRAEPNGGVDSISRPGPSGDDIFSDGTLSPPPEDLVNNNQPHGNGSGQASDTDESYKSDSDNGGDDSLQGDSEYIDEEETRDEVDRSRPARPAVRGSMRSHRIAPSSPEVPPSTPEIRLASIFSEEVPQSPVQSQATAEVQQDSPIPQPPPPSPQAERARRDNSEQGESIVEISRDDFLFQQLNLPAPVPSTREVSSMQAERTAQPRREDPSSSHSQSQFNSDVLSGDGETQVHQYRHQPVVHAYPPPALPASLSPYPLPPRMLPQPPFIQPINMVRPQFQLQNQALPTYNPIFYPSPSQTTNIAGNPMQPYRHPQNLERHLPNSEQMLALPWLDQGRGREEQGLRQRYDQEEQRQMYNLSIPATSGYASRGENTAAPMQVDGEPYGFSDEQSTHASRVAARDSSWAKFRAETKASAPAREVPASASTRVRRTAENDYLGSAEQQALAQSESLFLKGISKKPRLIRKFLREQKPQNAEVGRTGGEADVNPGDQFRPVSGQATISLPNQSIDLDVVKSTVSRAEVLESNQLPVRHSEVSPNRRPQLEVHSTNGIHGASGGTRGQATTDSGTQAGPSSQTKASWNSSSTQTEQQKIGGREKYIQQGKEAIISAQSRLGQLLERNPFLMTQCEVLDLLYAKGKMHSAHLKVQKKVRAEGGIDARVIGKYGMVQFEDDHTWGFPSENTSHPVLFDPSQYQTRSNIPPSSSLPPVPTRTEKTTLGQVLDEPQVLLRFRKLWKREQQQQKIFTLDDRQSNDHPVEVQHCRYEDAVVRYYKSQGTENSQQLQQDASTTIDGTPPRPGAPQTRAHYVELGTKMIACFSDELAQALVDSPSLLRDLRVLNLLLRKGEMQETHRSVQRYAKTRNTTPVDFASLGMVRFEDSTWGFAEENTAKRFLSDAITGPASGLPTSASGIRNKWGWEDDDKRAYEFALEWDKAQREQQVFDFQEEAIDLSVVPHCVYRNTFSNTTANKSGQSTLLHINARLPQDKVGGVSMEGDDSWSKASQALGDHGMGNSGTQSQQQHPTHRVSEVTHSAHEKILGDLSCSGQVVIPAQEEMDPVVDTIQQGRSASGEKETGTNQNDYLAKRLPSSDIRPPRSPGVAGTDLQNFPRDDLRSERSPPAPTAAAAKDPDFVEARYSELIQAENWCEELLVELCKETKPEDRLQTFAAAWLRCDTQLEERRDSFRGLMRLCDSDRPQSLVQTSVEHPRTSSRSTNTISVDNRKSYPKSDPSTPSLRPSIEVNRAAGERLGHRSASLQPATANRAQHIEEAGMMTESSLARAEMTGSSQKRKSTGNKVNSVLDDLSSPEKVTEPKKPRQQHNEHELEEGEIREH